MYICINCFLAFVDGGSAGGPPTENGGGADSQRRGASSNTDTQGQGDTRLQGAGSTCLKKYVHSIVTDFDSPYTKSISTCLYMYRMYRIILFIDSEL